MRLIYVTAYLPDGNSEAFIVPEIEALTRLGHEILVVPRSPGGGVVHGEGLVAISRREPLFSQRVLTAALRGSAADPVRALSAVACACRSRSAWLAMKNLAVLPKALWLASVARLWGAEHIHCHWSGTTATMALLASRISGIPWSLTAHRWDIVENNLLTFKAGSASFVRFISQDGLKLAKAAGVTACAKTRVIPMGVRIPEIGDLRPARDRVVLCPARLEDVKGHRFLVEAWRLLRDRGVEAKLWLAGEGALRSRLQTRIRELGLQDTVLLLGTVPHRSILRMYSEGAVSALVLPSVDLGNGCREGVPVSLVEAMSYAIPVVATPTGGITELVTPGAGLLVPPENPLALADAVQSLFVNPQLAQQVGCAGRRRVIEAHDVDRIAATLTGAFVDSPAQQTEGTEPGFGRQRSRRRAPVRPPSDVVRLQRVELRDLGVAQSPAIKPNLVQDTRHAH
jgi:glycosyltransferase involved in cell wall biosynthesis